MSKAQALPGRNEHAAPASAQRKRVRALLIAEDPSAGQQVLHQLEAAGFEVDLATEGDAGVRKLRDGKPDAVLLYLPLRDINALDLIKRARQQSANLPVFVFDHGFLMPMRTRKAIKAGATKVFDKDAAPIDQILTELKALLGIDARVAKPPQPTVAPPPALKTSHVVVDPLTESVATLRKQVTLIGRLDDPIARSGGFKVAHDVTQALVTCARNCGRQRIALLGRSLGAFLNDLREKPNQVTESSLRTINLAVKVLDRLVREPRAHQEPLRSKFLAAAVDNDPVSFKATQNALSNAGFEPRMFVGPREALNFLKEGPVDLVVLDVMIAAQDGFNLYDALRQLPQHTRTPVIFIANPRDPGLSENVLSGLHTQFLAKPQNLTHYLELALKALSRVLENEAENLSVPLFSSSPAASVAPAPATTMPVPHSSQTREPAGIDAEAPLPDKLSSGGERRSVPAPVLDPKQVSAGPPPANTQRQRVDDKLHHRLQAIPPEVASLREALTGKEKEREELAVKVTATQAELTQARVALTKESEVRRQLEEKLQSVWGSKEGDEIQAAADLRRRNEELENLLRESVINLERAQADHLNAVEEQRRLASEKGTELDGAKSAAEKNPDVHNQEAARCRELEEQLANLQLVCEELKRNLTAQAQAALDSSRRQAQLEGPRQVESDLEDGLSESRRVPQGLASLARATAELEKERGERRRSEQRSDALTSQLQELHEQLKQHLQSEGGNHARITALEDLMREREQTIARLTGDLEKEADERRLAEEQLRASGALSTQLQSCLSAFDQARKGFKRRQDELDQQLQTNQKALLESQSRLEEVMQDWRQGQEAIGGLQRNLKEQAQKGASELANLQSEISRLQSELDVEQAERRRLEGDAIQSRYGSLDSARIGLATVNRLRKEMRDPVNHLMESTRRLLEIQLEEQQKKLLESMLEDTLLLQTSLQGSGGLRDELPVLADAASVPAA